MNPPLLFAVFQVGGPEFVTLPLVLLIFGLIILGVVRGLRGN